MSATPSNHRINHDLAALLAAALMRCSEVRLAILFGSLARGQENADSDLDLALSLGRPLTTDERLEWIGRLGSEFGRPVDLVDLSQIGEPLLGQILQHGIRLFGSDYEYAELLKRHLFAQADFVPLQQRILEERRKAWIGR